jgi:hypothetical protein
LLALQALQLGRDWVQPKVQALAQVRAQVNNALQGLGDLVEFPTTQGAFYVLMKLPTLPGFAFGLNDTINANYQRLSYGALDAATVAEGVSRYVAAVKDWYAA